MTRFLQATHRNSPGAGRIVPVWALSFLILVLPACSQGGIEDATSAEGLQAFVGAQIIDGTGAGPIQDGVLLARDGVIERVGAAGDVDIPSGAEIIELGGRWLVPGFINAHGHVDGDRIAAVSQLEQYAHYGVTTVVSLGEEPGVGQLRDEQSTPDLDRSRIWVSGPVINPGSPEEARSTVAELASMNVDWVKIRVDDGLDTRPKMSPEVYQEVITAAEEHDLPVAIHVVDLEDAIGVVQAGGDLVAHSVRDQSVDQTLIDAMRGSGVCVVPTLTRELSTFVYAERPDFFDDPFFLDGAAPADLDNFITPELQSSQMSPAAEFFKEHLPVAQQNMSRLHDGGVGVAMGTDTGPFGRFQGYFEHLEMAMMVEGGLTAAETIHASTGGAAECMGLDGTVGTLETGAHADLVVLEENPLDDILNTRTIHSVWISGNQIR